MAEPLRVAVLGFALPPLRYRQIAANDAGMPAQTQRFGSSLLRALQLAGAEPIMISAAPVTDFPHNSQIVFRRSHESFGGVDYFEIGFINITLLKHLTRLASVLAEAIPVMRRQSTDVLVVHGVHSPFLAAALAARVALGVPVATVLTDPPNVPHSFDSRLSTLLKRVDSGLITWMLKRFDGVIALTEALAHDFAPGVPYLVMEGIAPGSAHEGDNVHTHPRNYPPEVVYAGGVSEEYGIGRLLRAHRLAANGFQLSVYGKGPLVDDVRQTATDQPGLRYGGIVDAHEVAHICTRADVLVNPRPVEQGFVRYSFPSKLLEYMESGTPVVSTRLPGIPGEYWSFIVGTDDSPEGIACTLVEVSGSQEAIEMGRRARDFVAREKGALPQGRRMRDFLYELSRDTIRRRRRPAGR